VLQLQYKLNIEPVFTNNILLRIEVLLHILIFVFSKSHNDSCIYCCDIGGRANCNYLCYYYCCATECLEICPQEVCHVNH